MMRRAGVVLLVVGILAILASGVLSIRTLLELRTPHLAATAAAQNSAKLQMTNLKLGPGLRAQAVLELSPSPTDTPPAALDFRLLDAAGQVVLADRVVVESSATNPIVIALRKWQPAAADPVSVDIQLLDLSGQPATVNGLTLRVFDRLKDYTVALILITYVGVCGVIAATVGGVRLLARAPRTPHQASTPAQIHRAAMLCHLSALAGYVVPFANLVGPLVMWLAGRDLDPTVERAGREALNFQLSILIYLLLAFALTLAFIGLLILPLLIVLQLSLTILAARGAAAGVEYRYPLTFRLV